ncbi:hypothetical protein AKO1_002938 [Acrasis kona]|uniref:MYND-type domain-containing protein n=1 Tax=Acrasis kona TaxID=1008807 RepID=A0AAW2Z6I1_9EUKA
MDVISSHQPLLEYFKTMFQSMSVFFHFHKNIEISQICKMVSNDIMNENVSLSSVGAIRAFIERSAYFCQSSQIDVTELSSYYRSNGLQKAILKVFKSRRKDHRLCDYPPLQRINDFVIRLSKELVFNKLQENIPNVLEIINVLKNEHECMAMLINAKVVELLRDFVANIWVEMDEWDGSSIMSSQLPRDKLCLMCAEDVGTIRCPKCRRAVYCSRNCQIAHWANHRPKCKTLKSL